MTNENRLTVITSVADIYDIKITQTTIKSALKELEYLEKKTNNEEGYYAVKLRQYVLDEDGGKKETQNDKSKRVITAYRYYLQNGVIVDVERAAARTAVYTHKVKDGTASTNVTAYTRIGDDDTEDKKRVTALQFFKVDGKPLPRYFINSPPAFYYFLLCVEAQKKIDFEKLAEIDKEYFNNPRATIYFELHKRQIQMLLDDGMSVKVVKEQMKQLDKEEKIVTVVEKDEELVKENEELKAENERLKKELEELKNGSLLRRPELKPRQIEYLHEPYLHLIYDIIETERAKGKRKLTAYKIAEKAGLEDPIVRKEMLEFRKHRKNTDKAYIDYYSIRNYYQRDFPRLNGVITRKHGN